MELLKTNKSPNNSFGKVGR